MPFDIGNEIGDKYFWIGHTAAQAGDLFHGAGSFVIDIMISTHFEQDTAAVNHRGHDCLREPYAPADRGREQGRSGLMMGDDVQTHTLF